MFKSDKDYKSLDDYFNSIRYGDHLRSNKRIKQRVKQIEKLFKPWPFNIHEWKHDPNNIENARKNSYCKHAIDVMSEAANCYIMGFFNASVAASSAGVESLIHVDSPYCVKIKKTSTGKLYQSKEYATLAEALTSVNKLGYPTKMLLDKNENDLYSCVFVQRRNIVAHGNHDDRFTIEHLSLLNKSPKADLKEVISEQRAALDQYKKASKFIIAILVSFEKKRK
jgi:hypothetical protein